MKHDVLQKLLLAKKLEAEALLMLLPPEAEKALKEASYLAGRMLCAVGESHGQAEQPSTAGKQTEKTRRVTINEEE